MANEQNLIPGGHKFTLEEASKGGKKSGEVRRMQSAIIKALDSKVTDEQLFELFEQFGIKKGDRRYSSAIACAVVKKAAGGDLSAMSFIRDTIGEKPKDEISVDGGVVIVDDLTGAAK